MEISSWQAELRETLRNPLLLVNKLGLQASQVEVDNAHDQSFPFKAPLPFISRIDKKSANDPLLLQILPTAAEKIQNQAYIQDPVGDLASQAVPGLLHKYHGRVLLLVTAACAIHCRYCFRQHFPYQDNNPGKHSWVRVLDYIGKDPSISEVILSGGDPLMLADEKLAYLFVELQRIPHLKRLRIHSRMPVVLPSRINNSFLALLDECRLKKVIVLHSNHARELDRQVRESIERLKSTDTLILNQAVLLKNINDSGQAQVELIEKLFDYGVLPYYLHMLDKVEGAAHFAVAESHALEIMQELRTVLPGYLVPRLVREQAGAPYKLPLL